MMTSFNMSMHYVYLRCDLTSAGLSVRGSRTKAGQSGGDSETAGSRIGESTSRSQVRSVS